MDVWKSIDSRSICFRQKDGWRNALGSVRLLAGEPKEYKRMEMRHADDHFAIMQDVRGIDRFDALMTNIRANRLRIGQRTIRLDCPVPPVQPGGLVSPYGYSFEVQQRRWARNMNYVVSDYHTWMLQGRGRQIADFVEVDELEHAARVLFRHKRPYE